jgi:peptide/nickel transport system substrate-binding protein
MRDTRISQMLTDLSQVGEEAEDPVFSRESFLRGGAAMLLAAPLVGGAGEALAASLARAPQPRPGGTLKAGFSSPGVETMNVHRQAGVLQVFWRNHIYEPLMTEVYTEEGVLTGKLSGRLATSIVPNRDATQWAINLRKGVVWQDGSPFTSDDVIYTLKAIADPTNSSVMRQVLNALNVDVNNIQRVNDHTLVLNLTKPVWDFDYQSTVLPSSSGRLLVFKNGVDPSKQTIGTGPFGLGGFTPGVSASLVRHKNYWDAKNVYLDGIQTFSINDSSARLNGVRSKQLDWAEDIPPAYAKLNQRSKFVKIIKTAPSGGVSLELVINTRKFTDPRVVLALKLACDRQALIDNVLLGYGALGNDLNGEGVYPYNASIPQRKYDPEKARSLLKQAGADNLQLTITTTVGQAQGSIDAAPLYAQQLSKVGVRATVQQNTLGQILADVAGFDQTFDIWAASTGQTVLASMNSARPGALFNFQGWSPAEWVAKLDSAATTKDPKARLQIYRDLQVQMQAEGGILDWGQTVTINAATPKLFGIESKYGEQGYAPSFYHSWFAK